MIEDDPLPTAPREMGRYEAIQMLLGCVYSAAENTQEKTGIPCRSMVIDVGIRAMVAVGIPETEIRMAAEDASFLSKSSGERPDML
jgi:hypothetical protein